MDIVREGTRVVRGPDWEKGDEDGGEGHVGTVKVVHADKTVDVVWDNRNTGTYSVGNNRKYDLLVFDNGFAGCGKKNGQDDKSSSNLYSKEENEVKSVNTDEDTSNVFDYDAQQYPYQKEDRKNQEKESAAEPNKTIKKTTPQIGNEVRVINNLQLVRTAMNKQWSNDIKHFLGKIGIITHIYTDATWEITFGDNAWVFLPECCEVMSETKKDVPCRTSDELSMASASSSINDNTERTLHHLVRALGEEERAREERARDELAREELAREELAREVLAGEELAREFERFYDQYTSASDLPSELLFQAVLTNNATETFLTAIRFPHLINVKRHDLTALMLACLKGHTDVAKVLLNCEADVNAMNTKGATPLIFAIANGHEPTAELLLQMGADVNLKDIQGRGPMHYAAMKTSPTLIKELLVRNANPNVQDQYGNAPLHVAILEGNMAAATQLISDKKVNLQIRNKNEQNPLFICATRNWILPMEAILQRCPVHKFPAMTDGTIQSATIHSQEDAVRLLIKMGVDVNRSHRDYLLPLHDACLSGHFSISKFLVEAGACVNRKDISGVTPLHLCVAPDSPCLSSANQTEDFAFNLSMTKAKNAHNKSPEKMQERIDLACYLIKHGASVHIIDGLGHTSLEVCTDQQMKDNIIQAVQLHRKKGTVGINLYDRILSAMPMPCFKCKKIMSNIRLIPCGHVVLCRTCTLDVKDCPRCNTRVEEQTVLCSV